MPVLIQRHFVITLPLNTLSRHLPYRLLSFLSECRGKWVFKILPSPLEVLLIAHFLPAFLLCYVNVEPAESPLLLNRCFLFFFLRFLKKLLAAHVSFFRPD